MCISGTEALSFLKFLFPKVFRDNSLYFQIYCGFTLTLTITINLYIYVYLSSNCSKEINVFFNNNSHLGLLAYIYIFNPCHNIITLYFYDDSSNYIMS